jgi:ATP-dependent protease ClpP protease subunit
MKCIKKIYLEHTKLKEPELDDILKHDIYLDAEEALKYGIVDEII